MSDNTVALDIELHRMIEACRRSFDESRLEIIKRAFRASVTPKTTTRRSVKDAAIEPVMPRRSRRGGNYELTILGQTFDAGSLKDVLKMAILAIEGDRPGFIEKLAQHRTSRGRRIVARTPDEVYPGKPQLVHCAEKLDGKWWYDTNISNNQCKRYLRLLSKIGGFKEARLKP